MDRVRDRGSCARLIGLIYELLDAHDDTTRLAADLASNPMWRPHLVYLRDLQRVGREVQPKNSTPAGLPPVSGAEPCYYRA
jgi:hypothetical protein